MSKTPPAPQPPAPAPAPQSGAPVFRDWAAI